MASLSLEEAQRSIRERGYYILKNAAIGNRVDEIVKHGFQFKTNEGLELYRVAVPDHPHVRDIIESFFPRSLLGFYKIYGQTTDDHCIISGTPELSILVVSPCTSGTEIIFREGSHLHDLNAEKARNGLLRPDAHRLTLPGISAARRELNEGGVVIWDARLSWKTLKGKTILLGMMTPEELKHWVGMDLPDHLADKARSLERDTIGANFTFMEPHAEPSDTDKT